MPAERLLFHNGTLITDSGLIPNGMLIVRNGRIDHAGPFASGAIPPNAEWIDAGGLYIAPGFVDIHVHGGAGSDFMDATAADIETVFQYHSTHGTTSLCPTTATAPVPEILAALDALERYRSGDQCWGRALGAHIEGPYLSASKRGCHLPEHLCNPEAREWRQILERGPIASLTLAPELPGARELVEALHNQGANANAGHSEALYHEISESIAWGVNHVTHLYCAMTDAMNNRWRGTPNPRAAGIVEAVYLDDRLSSELITDGKHLSREMLRLAWRNKGYEKLAIITDAMRGAGMPDGEYTFGPRHGMVAVVRGREARIPDGTALASSVFPMNEMVRVFRDLVGCPIWQAVRMASLTPAEIVHADEDAGSLSPGKWADILLIDDKIDVKAVFLGGKRL
ncbi:MAG TPA: N-acetylglucosamine-6-phosphate deacetylase [Bryobacteraceae bacterium]|jgi:N-acetylglucosamine-6-phosphate deacetylase|nr:N-acetylglucosamine-6-phosphate deacetylase [Bryobacteraceae bacterium]